MLSWLVCGLLGIGCYGGAFGFGLNSAGGSSSLPLIWPGAGLGLFIAYRWGAAAAGLVGVTAFVLASYVFSSPLAGAGHAVAYGGAAFLASWFLRRRSFGTGLEHLRDVFRFIAIGVVLASLWSAFWTAAGLVASGHPAIEGTFSETFGSLWLADALGTLVMAPVLFVWSTSSRLGWRKHPPLEVLLWMGILIALNGTVFRFWAPLDTLRYPLELAVFPVLIWGAVRFGQRATTAGIIITTLLAVWSMDGTAPGNGVGSGSVSMWVFVGIIASTSILLAAAFAEYRNREEEIRMNEQRLRAFVRAIPDLAFVISDSGWYLDVFAPRASVFSERAQMLKGRRLHDIYPDSLQRQFLRVINEVLDSGEVRVWRYVMDFRGKPHWFEGRVAPMEPIDGHPRSVFWVAYDITESQRANAALRERDRLLQAVTEAEAVLLKTQDYQTGIRRTLEIIGQGMGLDRIQVFLLRSSAGSEDLRAEFLWSHRAEAEPMGSGGGGVVPIVITEAEFRGPWATLRSGATWSMRNRADAPAKISADLPSNVTMSSLWVPIFVDEQFAGAIEFSVFREVTRWNDNARAVLSSLAGSVGGFIETKRIEDALKEAKRQADEANSAKSDFLAMMSHEIRTPMNAILGFADLLEQSCLDEQQNEYTKIISRSGKDLLELINHILDFSKLESGPIQLEHTPFNLETVIMEVLEIMLMKAREKEIELNYELEDGGNRFYRGDPLRVRQILLNLVSNAVKFTPDGEVKVKVTSRRESEQTYLLHLAVEDTGIGIPANKMDRLFVPFSQVDSSTTREYGGTGLGLTICQRLAEKMDGRIWAESDPGKGSTFHVEIRVEAESTAVPSPREDTERTLLEVAFAERFPLRILVAEDDPRNTLLVREVLKQLGYSAVCVEDGREAAECLRTRPFDVVLLDIHMAHLDGLTVAQMLRQGELEDLNRDTWLVALTASVMLEDEMRCRQAGINAFMGKPFSVHDLRRELEVASRQTASAGLLPIDFSSRNGENPPRL